MSNDSVSPWTREVPRESGWYWVRYAAYRELGPYQVVELASDKYTGQLYVSRTGDDVDGWPKDYLWYPVALTPPEG